MLEIIPAIDLSDGCVVRLKRGEFDQKTIYSDDPPAVARSFVSAGARRLHIVDLDGARTGEPIHLEMIRKIASEAPVPLEVGGGIRTATVAKKIGGIPTVDRIILGTAAVENPQILKEILSAAGKKHVVISVDVKEGKVATRGWMAETESDPIEFGRSVYEAGVRMAVYTDVRQDGMMTGPNVEATRLFAEATGLEVIVSGGISSLTDLELIKSEGHPKIIGVIVGRAIYEGVVDIAEAVRVFSHDS